VPISPFVVTYDSKSLQGNIVSGIPPALSQKSINPVVSDLFIVMVIFLCEMSESKNASFEFFDDIYKRLL